MRMTREYTVEMSNPTVRLNPYTYRVLKELASQSGEPMLVILDRAVEEERRRRFFEEANASYARLKEDAAAWADFKSETAAWDVTLLDGLEHE